MEKIKYWIHHGILAPLIMEIYLILGDFDSTLTKTWFCFQIIKVTTRRIGEDPKG